MSLHVHVYLELVVYGSYSPWMTIVSISPLIALSTVAGNTACYMDTQFYSRIKWHCTVPYSLYWAQNSCAPAEKIPA